MPPAAVRGVHDQLGGGRLDGVGVLQLRVPDELAVDAQQQMPHPRPRTTPQLQPPLLGDGLLAVRAGGVRDEPEHGFGLGGGEGVDGVDLPHGGGRLLLVSHGVEGTAAAGPGAVHRTYVMPHRPRGRFVPSARNAVDGNPPVTGNPLSRYAR